MSNSGHGVGNTISGLVGGAVVQTGAVHGDVHFHGSGAWMPVPRQLLPPPRGFTDRATELSLLNDLLAQSGVVVLRGPGGVGKTALALRWFDGVASRFPDGQLYADLALSTGEPVAPEDVLGHFLRSLGKPPREIPVGLAERSALYRSVTAGKALALLLDNALSAAQVRVLLPASEACATVVTSRRPLLGVLAAGARAAPVEPLDSAAALELLTYHVGGERAAADHESARRLAEFCAGLPIALCVVGARAAARPRRSLARMVDELADERARLDALSVEGDLSVRSTFDMAYAELPVESQNVYRALGLHPSGSFETGVVAAMLEADASTAHRWLDAVVDASLADELDDDRYRLHALVHVHAFDQAVAYDDEETRAELTRRAGQWYVFAAHAANRLVMPARAILDYPLENSFVRPLELDSPAGALQWLERHRNTMMTIMRDAVNRDWAELGYQLADAMQPVLILHGHRTDSLTTAEIGLRAAEAGNDPVGQTRMLKRVARALIALGDLDRAQEHADELLRRTRGENRRGEASALKTVALIEIKRGRLAEGAEALTRSAEILRMLGRRRGEGLALINLGETLTRAGATSQAVEHLRRARELLRTLSKPDLYNEARACAALGYAYLRRGDSAARPVLDHALTVFADYGSDHQRGRVHEALAELSRRAGDENQARRHEDLARTLLARTENAAGS